MEPRLPEDPAKLRALLPRVVRLIRSGRAALEAKLAGLVAHAPALANTTEPSVEELEREESPALQQLIRQALSQWYRHRSVLEAAIAAHGGRGRPHPVRASNAVSLRADTRSGLRLSRSRSPPARAVEVVLEGYEQHRVAGEDIWVIPNFAQEVLKIDPAAFLRALERYPSAGKGQQIEEGKVQWVTGDHQALLYRGHELKRGKIWLQKGNPQETGFLRYLYTGWQWEILRATCAVEACPEAAEVAARYDAWAEQRKMPGANHYIVTMYRTAQHGIGWHYDKPRSILPRSLITVVKLGAHGRPFQLRWRRDKAAQAKEPPFFDQVLIPGTAVITTIEANLKTQHAVPEVDEAGPSGSIVLRNITDIVPREEYARRLESARANKGKRKKAVTRRPVSASSSALHGSPP